MYPFLEIFLNKRYSATYLAKTGSSNLYDFGAIDIPISIVVDSISIKIGSYFNTSFDVIENSDSNVDVNRDIKNVNDSVLEWSVNYSVSTPFIEDSQGTVPSCNPRPWSDMETPISTSGQKNCNFSGFEPGYWDNMENSFIPNGCTIQRREIPRHNESVLNLQKQFKWILFKGDSNIRKLFFHICQMMKGSDIYQIDEEHKDLWPNAHVRTKPFLAVCFSPCKQLALMYSVSWLDHENHILDFASTRNLSGMPLSSIVCNSKLIPFIPNCTTVWNIMAQNILVSAGSHFPQLLIPYAYAKLYKWLHDELRFIPRRSELILVLIPSVCIDQFHFLPRYWPQLFHRNNYRVKALNNISVFLAQTLGLRIFDLFSLTLSAGCINFGDVVHAKPQVYQAEAEIYFDFI